MTAPRSPFVILLVVLVLVLSAWLHAQTTVRIRMGTVVPKGSLWDESLQYVRQDWRRISEGTVNVTIYPGAVLGDETEMVQQARQGRIQAVGLSSVGLSRIDSGVSCLQIPMMLESYDELDYVRDRIAPALERRIEEKGFKVLNWADGGWVHAFTKEPAPTPDDLRAMKLFTSVGDPETESLYKQFGFHVVPLSLTDMVTSLQTGMIDAFTTVPLFAQLDESYRLASNMTDVKWTPLVGATVITLRAWEQIPRQHRVALERSARAAGDRLRTEIRAMGDDAVAAMQNRGLNVVDVDEPTVALWRTEAEKAYPQMRRHYCPTDLFDQVERLRDEFRASQG